jgi:hypothetical protein
MTIYVNSFGSFVCRPTYLLPTGRSGVRMIISIVPLFLVIVPPLTCFQIARPAVRDEYDRHNYPCLPVWAISHLFRLFPLLAVLYCRLVRVVVYRRCLTIANSPDMCCRDVDLLILDTDITTASKYHSYATSGVMKVFSMIDHVQPPYFTST